MNITPFTSLIQKAWQFRLEQKIEDTLLLASQVKLQLGMSMGALNQESIRTLLTKTDDPILMADFLLLHASLLRAKKDINGSQNLIQNVEQSLSEKSLAPGFRLFFEKGLTSLIHGRYSQALEEFLAASQMASTDDTRAAALINALLCIEDLGFDYSLILKKTEKIFSKIKRSRYEGLFDQLDSFKLRKLFRSGQIRLMKLNEGATTSKPFQAGYYKLWVSQIPYHRYTPKQGLDPRQLHEKTSKNLYLRSFRIGTLLGTLHPHDSDVTKPSEIIERLYLWTWKWLVNPQAFPIQKIMAILRSGDFLKNLHHLSAEDVQMARNALLWLGLFDSSSAGFLMPLLSRLKVPHSAHFPVFEFENLIVEYFKAIRDGHRVDAEDFRKQVESHPLFRSPDLFLGTLVKIFNDQNGSTGNSPLGNLTQNLKALCQPDSMVTGLIVDLTKYRLSGKTAHQTIFSRPLCLALDLMHSRHIVPAQDFVRICFDSSFYDSVYHGPKIFNLTARLRKILPPTLRLRVKEGFVIAEGSWQGITFIKDTQVSEELKQQPEWRALIKKQTDLPRETLKAAPLETDLLAVLSRHEGPLSRTQLETLMGKSRSTANRILEKWIQEGRVIKTGNARNTRYIISKPTNSALKENLCV